MRPVRRNASPQAQGFDPYKEAQPHLISRLGPYCSYCERRIETMLLVEHVQPKSLEPYAGLIGRWENFLLGCPNCNSTKGNKDVVFTDVLLPDRDNTYAAYRYTEDGKVTVRDGLPPEVAQAASATLSLVGLDKPVSNVVDENGKMVAIDRVAQRMQRWLMARVVKSMVDAAPRNESLRKLAVINAKSNGFFSIWMTVFEDDPDMRKRLVEAFEATADSGCFDQATAAEISPAPNPDGLPHGGII